MQRPILATTLTLSGLFVGTPRQAFGVDYPQSNAPPVVIELFTSEGCSSCPPAELLAAEINRIARDQGLPVYALEMHVDYWDRLGWKDPFADAAFTARQRRYATLLASNRLYTPQMVVNGRVEFVGSDAKRARAAILAELEAKPAVSIHLQVHRTGRSWQVSGQTTGHQDGDSVVAALVLPKASSAVATGENAGRRLKHTNVVLTLGETPLAASGDFGVTLRLPEGRSENPDLLSVICMVQRGATGRVVGARPWPQLEE
ncbi:MAG: DUF1223 domain-containing protein [Planctomycetota bacterium]